MDARYRPDRAVSCELCRRDSETGSSRGREGQRGSVRKSLSMIWWEEEAYAIRRKPDYAHVHKLISQHSAINPSSSSAQYSLKTALQWFESQYQITKGKGAPKNINTMSPFYSLASFLLNGQVKDERWTAWCDEWAEWIMNDLPKTREGGFQHSEWSESPFYPLLY